MFMSQFTPLTSIFSLRSTNVVLEIKTRVSRVTNAPLGLQRSFIKQVVSV